MKKRTTTSCLILFGMAAMAQNTISTDPSVSERNYKHPDKVAIASERNAGSTIKLLPVVVPGNAEYKHPFNRNMLVVRASMNSSRAALPARSNKHPLGL